MLLILERIFGYLNQTLIFALREHGGRGEEGGEQSTCRNLKKVKDSGCGINYTWN